jgi:hypothetical protein
MHMTQLIKGAPGRARNSTRWLAAAVLLGGLGLVAGSGAQADTTGSNGETIFTQIVLTGAARTGGTPNVPVGWVPPKCWLEPNSGFGVDPAYTPDGFARYMAQLNALFHHTDETDLQYQTNQIYYHGVGADPIVGLSRPPYNEGLSGGKWYEIACAWDATFGDYEAFKASLGTTNDYEEWFWFRDAAPPRNVPIADPNLLAEYAAANTKVDPGWPNFNPALNTMQTVNLATQVTNPAGANGFRRYTATATLQTTGLSSTVYATPDTLTLTSSGPISPSTVTCKFNKNGSLQKGCNFTFLKSTATGYVLTETTTWNVTWGGDPVTGEPGWTHRIGPFTANFPNVRVQEIQTVVGN